MKVFIHDKMMNFRNANRKDYNLKFDYSLNKFHLYCYYSDKEYVFDVDYQGIPSIAWTNTYFFSDDLILECNKFISEIQ